MFRLLLPSFVSFVIFLVVLTIAYVVVNKNLPLFKKIAKQIYIGVIVIYLLSLGVYAFKIASVNEVPRSEPDRSLSKKASNSFVEKSRKGAKADKLEADSLLIESFETK